MTMTRGPQPNPTSVFKNILRVTYLPHPNMGFAGSTLAANRIFIPRSKNKIIRGYTA